MWSDTVFLSSITVSGLAVCEYAGGIALAFLDTTSSPHKLKLARRSSVGIWSSPIDLKTGDVNDRNNVAICAVGTDLYVAYEDLTVGRLRVIRVSSADAITTLAAPFSYPSGQGCNIRNIGGYPVVVSYTFPSGPGYIEAKRYNSGWSAADTLDSTSIYSASGLTFSPVFKRIAFESLNGNPASAFRAAVCGVASGGKLLIRTYEKTGGTWGGDTWAPDNAVVRNVGGSTPNPQTTNVSIAGNVGSGTSKIRLGFGWYGDAWTTESTVGTGVWTTPTTTYVASMSGLVVRQFYIGTQSFQVMVNSGSYTDPGSGELRLHSSTLPTSSTTIAGNAYASVMDAVVVGVSVFAMYVDGTTLRLSSSDTINIASISGGVSSSSTLGGRIRARFATSRGISAGGGLVGSLTLPSIDIGGGVVETLIAGGRVSTTINITGGISLSPTLGGGLAYPPVTFEDKGIAGGGGLGGKITVVRGPGTTAEDRYRLLGHRPLHPLIVYATDCVSMDDVEAIRFPFFEGAWVSGTPYEIGDIVRYANKTYISRRKHTSAVIHSPDNVNYWSLNTRPCVWPFLVGSMFVNTSDPLASLGAQPGSIGAYVLPVQGAGYYLFRNPDPFEVVWHIEVPENGSVIDRGTYRWGTSAWRAYQTLGERIIRQQLAFDVLDPEGIYRYFGRLVGVIHTQLMVDNYDLSTMVDPAVAPDRVLPFLARQMLFRVRESDAPSTTRRRLRTAFDQIRAKGLPRLASSRLQELGYRGHVSEVWFRPKDEYQWGSINDPVDYLSLDRLIQRAVEDEDAEKVTELRALRADINRRGLLKLLPLATGSKSNRVRVKPCGWRPTSIVENDDDDRNNQLSLTSRVVVHVNRFNGSPIDTAMSGQTLRDFQENIATELRQDVLPAHVDIKFFATDVRAASDRILVTDRLTVTVLP